MSAETAVETGRARAEARMLDTCTITAAGGERTFDDDTGSYTTPAATVIYTGKCKVQGGSTTSTPEAGGTVATLRDPEVHIPVDAPRIPINAIATITAIGPRTDATLLDRRFRVAADPAKTFATARRLRCEEVLHGQ